MRRAAALFSEDNSGKAAEPCAEMRGHGGAKAYHERNHDARSRHGARTARSGC